MSPNPTVISQSPESENDRSLIKIIILAFLGIVAIVGAVHLFNQFLLTAAATYFWGSVAASGFFLALTILDAFFVKSGVKLNLIIFLEALAALAVFYSRFLSELPVVLIAAAAIFFIFLAASVNRGSHYLTNSLKIKFWPTARAILPGAVTGLLIFLTVVLYLNYFIWGNFSDAIGQRLVDGTLLSANPILQLQFPNTSFNDTVHDFLAHVAEAQLKKIKTSAVEKSSQNFENNFSLLPPAARETAIIQVSAQLKANLEEIVGSLDEKKEVRVVIYELIKNYVENLASGVRMALGIAFAVLIFFALKSTVALFYWFVILIAFILFKLLLVVGFAYINLETRSREYIMLS